MAHLAYDPHDLGNLLGIRSGQDAAFDEQAVLKSDPHIAAHERSLG